ncbi:MAG: site-2 protease family protein [Candidatus Saccharibacteria bacterium]|nr:site-2 protease family protein [Candidatus Saccharibacteria bacterium]
MNIMVVVCLFVAIIFSTVLHELAHGWTAYLLGDTTAKEEGRLSLNPLRHIDPVMSLVLPIMLYLMGMPILGGAKPVPIDSRRLKGGAWGMALVAIMGPLTNFLLAFLVFGIGVATHAFILQGGNWYVAGEMGVILNQIVLMELGFFLFNIIPIPPLDGSRVLYAISPDVVRDFLRRVEPYGIMVVYGLLVFLSGVFSRYMSGAMEGIIQFFWFIFG